MSDVVKKLWQDVVNEWLEDREVSRASLCREAGLSETHFAHQISGRRRITKSTLNRVEEVMGVEPDTLVELKRVADSAGEVSSE